VHNIQRLSGALTIIPELVDTILPACMHPLGGQINAKMHLSPLLLCLRECARVAKSEAVLSYCPRIVFVIVFLLNFFLIARGSSGAVPFGGYLMVIMLPRLC
jgi:hypothetical protein